MKISIIGAGIGGLTTALALQKHGREVEVYESAAVLQPAGAGIILASNAMQVFKALGIQEEVEAAGHPISCMNITDPQLKRLSRMDLSRYERRYGVRNTAIHRARLQRILLEKVGSVNLSKRLTGISSTGELSFADGTRVSNSRVIAADGIRSVVRNQLFEGSKLRDAKQLCWRGICPTELPDAYRHELNEAWGPGRRFGFVQIGEGQVYWYALCNAGTADTDLSEMFRDFHHEIKRLIAETPADARFETPIFDLDPIPAWHKDGVCLLGDAAHATTPNMGQGACQAIEDAYVLGNLLGSGMPEGQAFAKYEKIRKKKAVGVVRTSWSIGKMAHIENGAAIWLRNRLMQLSPEWLSRKQTDRLYEMSDE